jgi:hypothetical protein
MEKFLLMRKYALSIDVEFIELVEEFIGFGIHLDCGKRQIRCN